MTQIECKGTRTEHQWILKDKKTRSYQPDSDKIIVRRVDNETKVERCIYCNAIRVESIERDLD